MAKSNYELIVVGAGVVGMGIALAAHKKGEKRRWFPTNGLCVNDCPQIAHN